LPDKKCAKIRAPPAPRQTKSADLSFSRSWAVEPGFAPACGSRIASSSVGAPSTRENATLS
jgi:hypothetical protein